MFRQPTTRLMVGIVWNKTVFYITTTFTMYLHTNVHTFISVDIEHFDVMCGAVSHWYSGKSVFVLVCVSASVWVWLYQCTMRCKQADYLVNTKPTNVVESTHRHQYILLYACIWYITWALLILLLFFFFVVLLILHTFLHVSLLCLFLDTWNV